MKLPKEIAETPYEVSAFRVSHFHVDEEEDGAFPGTILVEFAGQLPGTEAEVMVPLEMTTDTALRLMDELIHQYRCLAIGLDEDELPSEP
jgi:hypothetical protein